MMMKVYIIWLSLLCIAGSMSAQSDSTQPAIDTTTYLTMQDCIRLGLQSATDVLKSQNAVKITGVQLFAAYGQFLPDLTFGAAYTYNGGNTLYTTTIPTLVNSRQNILEYQLLSTVNLFNGFNDYSALKAATLSKTAYQFNLERVRQSIVYDVEQTYLQIILDKRIVEYAKENLKASSDRQEQLKELTDVGRKALSDYYQQLAETSSDKLFLIQSQEKEKNDKILLLRKIRISKPDQFSLSEALSDTLPYGPDYQNVDDLINRAMNQRPDLKSAETNIKMYDWDIRQAKSGYYPKLNADFGLVSNGSYLNESYINGISQPLITQEPLGQALFGQVYGTVGLALSWRIFDKFYTKTNVDLNRLYRSNAEIDRDDLTYQITSDIRTAFNDYVSALQQIETSTSGLQAAQQSFEVIQEKYNVGSSNFIDLSNAQAVLLQAKVDRAQALVKLSLQKKVIDYYLGN
jgi:outer membrane protein